jgi:hypothetical protein
MDTRDRGREHQCDSNRRTEGYIGQPSHYRVGTIYDEVPATHWTFKEQRALRQLCQAKGEHHPVDLPTNDIFSDPVVYETSTDRQFRSEAIVITPIAREFLKHNKLGHENQRTTNLSSVGNTLTGNSSAVTPKIAGPTNMEVQNIRQTHQTTPGHLEQHWQPRDDLLSIDLVAIDTHPPHVEIGNSSAGKECGSDAIVISPDTGN